MYKKIISSLLSLVVLSTSLSVFAYSDCDNATVEKLTELNVLSGYEDGTFRPDSYLSRAELSKIVAVTAGGKSKLYEETDAFSDIGVSHWAWNYIIYCKNSEFVNGYEDGTFKPGEYMTFAEAVKATMSAAGYNVLADLAAEENDAWYDVWMNLAYEYKVINSEKDIDPNGKITRAEVSELVWNVVNLPICVATGFSFSDGAATVQYEFLERDKFESLLTRYLE